MNNVIARKKFASIVENEFLPTIVKPGRYISAEWVCPSEDSENGLANDTFRRSGVEESLPLAVIVSLKSYERSVNEPLVAATRLAALDSGCVKVGMTYPFGAESLEALSALKLEPFVCPSFTALNQADILIAPLKNWAELSSAPRVLQAANIPLSKSERCEKNGENSFPRIIVVIDDGVYDRIDDNGIGIETDDTSAQKSPALAVPRIVTEIFDSVLSLSEFLATPELCLKTASAKPQRASGAKVSPVPLLPSRPVISVVEVSQHKARFGFRSVSGSGSSVLSAALSKNIKLSGLTEIELEDCGKIASSVNPATNPAANLAEVIDTLAHQIEARRYALSLRDLAPEQVTPLLSGALARFRRVRVELSTPSLSVTALASATQSLTFDRARFSACLAQLQFESLQSLHLRVQLGYHIDVSVEAQETVETMRACASVLSPRRGLRVKFERHVSPFAPIHDTKQISVLFEDIKRRGRIKGVTYFLEDSFPKLFEALIERDAFGSPDEMEAFVESSQSFQGTLAQESALWTKYRDILTRGQLTKSCISVARRNCEPQADALDTINRSPQPVEVVASLANAEAVATGRQSSFGRRKKRTGLTTVSAPTRTRLRFTWSVSGPARFLSHLDNIRAIEAALLRSGLALSYTQGQRPRLKISFGAPKPVGFTSECELFDAYFETAPVASALTGLDSLLPSGYRIVSASQSLTKELSIFESVQSATYLIGLQDERLSEALAGAIAQNRLLITRKGKKRERQIDLRPGVYEACILEQSDRDFASYFNFGVFETSAGAPLGCGQVLKLTLALTDTFYVRPEEFLAVAGILTREEARKTRIHRRRFGYNPMQPLPTKSARIQSVSGA